MWDRKYDHHASILWMNIPSIILFNLLFILTWLDDDRPYWKLFSFAKWSVCICLKQGCRKATTEFYVPLSALTIDGQPISSIISYSIITLLYIIIVTSNGFNTLQVVLGNDVRICCLSVPPWPTIFDENIYSSCIITSSSCSSCTKLHILPIYTAMNRDPIGLQFIIAVNMPHKVRALYQMNYRVCMVYHNNDIYLTMVDPPFDPPIFPALCHFGSITLSNIITVSLIT